MVIGCIFDYQRVKDLLAGTRKHVIFLTESVDVFWEREISTQRRSGGEQEVAGWAGRSHAAEINAPLTEVVIATRTKYQVSVVRPYVNCTRWRRESGSKQARQEEFSLVVCHCRGLSRTPIMG